ncbi:MAG: HAD family hydrolase [Nitrososphaerota archaeon]
MKPLAGVKALLFDFDNTLVDSASAVGIAHLKTAEAIVADCNLEVQPANVAEIISQVEREMEEQLRFDRDQYWHHVLKRLGVADMPENSPSRWSELYWRHYSTAAVFPDVEPTLSKLVRTHRLGMVTNTDGKPGLKRRRLEIYDLTRFFEVVVVAGDDVGEVKPSLQPFLKAAEMLNVSPRDCAMVGDHPRNDVAGARAAGMTAVLLARRGRSGYSGDVSADLVIGSLSELLLIV